MSFGESAELVHGRSIGKDVDSTGIGIVVQGVHQQISSLCTNGWREEDLAKSVMRQGYEPETWFQLVSGRCLDFHFQRHVQRDVCEHGPL